MKDKTVHLNLKPEGGHLISETYLMDCMLGMKEYPDKYFDLAVVDPPYGLGEKLVSGGTWAKNRKSEYSDWDKVPPIEFFTELFRVSKNQIIFGGNYFHLPPCRCFIIWDKPSMRMPTMADCEFAWTSFDSVAKIATINQEKGDDRIHLAQKPIKLYDWIYNKFAEPGFKILDTHLGSGSNRIAAHKNGLHFVGFEIDEEYYYSQEARFKSYLSQPTLFELPRAVGVLNSNAPTLNFEQGTEL